MYYHELTDAEKKLLTLMSEIGFGRIENLEISCGVIALTPESRKISSASFEHADNIQKERFTRSKLPQGSLSERKLRRPFNHFDRADDPIPLIYRTGI